MSHQLINFSFSHISIRLKCTKNGKFCKSILSIIHLLIFYPINHALKGKQDFGENI